jgi:penicillin-binding protein 2
MINPFGRAFSDEIIKGEKVRKIQEIDESSDKQSQSNIIFFILMLIVGLGILLARLFVLTIIEGDRYKKLASGNRIREEKIVAPRGIIYDRNGRALVRNIPLFKGSNNEVYFERKPSTISAELQESVTREYIFGDTVAHAVGFIGEAGENEDREPGDIVGKMGVEKSYDDILHGVSGRELTEVDAMGEQVRVLGRIEPIAGRNLTLSIDLDLQKIAKEDFKDKKGAIVAENPKTGEVYLLYSSPTFDPNIFIRGEEVEKVLTDENQPLFDRATSGLYPPGSTFKIVTALAALEDGAISRDTKFEDTGILQVGAFSFSNWYFTQYGRKEGMLDIVSAIRRSNDIFFYKTGEALGIEKLAKFAKKVGVGTTSGIDIPGEEGGLMPDPQWQEKTRGQPWYLGNTYHIAIGQGDILTTPLQINAWTNVIANSGKLCKPYLVQGPALANASAGKQIEQCKDLGIKKETINLIKEGMKEACSPGGTGWPMFKFKIANSKLKIDGIDFFPTAEATISGQPMVEIPVGCKTGTAEFGDSKGRTHALFTIFAPVVNPQISVTVVVEGGGEGSNVAAPIAKKILESWFEK